MTIDPPGTCHLVGCEGKGVHPPHYSGLAAPTPESYARQMADAPPAASRLDNLAEKALQGTFSRYTVGPSNYARVVAMAVRDVQEAVIREIEVMVLNAWGQREPAHLPPPGCSHYLVNENGHPERTKVVATEGCEAHPFGVPA